MSFCRYHNPLVSACLLFGLASAEERGLEERFRDPSGPAGGLSVELRLDPARGDTAESVVRKLERVRELGAGGVLVSLPVADESVWGLLAAAATWCRKNRVELGVCDFWLSAEEAAATPRLQTLVWSARTVPGASLATNLLPWAYGPGEAYREIARLAVPVEEPVLPNRVADLARGTPPPEGQWRVFWFGHTDRAPEVADAYQGAVVFRHVNEGLVALQSRLAKSYGTAFLWYQCAGAGPGELVWPADIESAFLKRGGLGLTRHLPVLAGVPVGGEAAAAHVRQLLAEVLREAWRSRYAENVNDLVHESGLEAGIAISEVPIEPDEVALYFRRPTLPAARSAAQRARNVRAAGAARTLARRFVVGRLEPAAVADPPDAALLPFPFKHEMDGLFGDGATRILLALGADELGGEKGAAPVRQACRYACSCQLLLQLGEPVADLLVWAHRLPQALEGFSCDYASQKMVEAAVVRGGRIRFASERSYGALAVSTEVLRESSAERLVGQLADKGLAVWLVSGGSAEDEAVCRRLAGGERRPCRILQSAGDLGLVPDLAWKAEEAGMQVRFLHRRGADREIYFVMNGSASGGVAACTFRDTAKGVPERWDPRTGEIDAVREFERQPDGRLTAPLFLGPHDSCFIVFGG